MKKIGNYMKRHLFVEITVAGVLFFTLTLILMMGFLRREYLKYLMDETTKTEKTILSISADNLNEVLKNAVVSGAEIAIDNRLLSQVEVAISAKETSAREIQSLRYVLNSRTHFNNQITALAIVTENGLLCEYGRYWSQSGYGKLWKGENLEVLNRLYDQTIERASVQGAGKYQISTEPISHENFDDMVLFHVAYPLLGDHVDLKDSSIVVVITYELSDIVAVTAMNETNSKDIVEYITDQDGNIIYYHDRSYLGQKEKYPLYDKSNKLDQELKYFGWEVHAGINRTAMEEEVWEMFVKGILVYLVFLMLMIIIWQMVMHNILKPVSIIGSSMEKIREGNLNERIDIRGEHELWQLAKEYNGTVDALEVQRKKTEQAFTEKMLMMEQCNEAERSALEAQINAHFMFNTLGAISYSAMENEDAEVADLLKSLSNILYYSFSKRLKNVTLGDELRWVEQYLYLQKYRLMDVFDYEIIFPEEYEEWPCCKLFLQPFVENSILHGFDGWDEGGMIRIIGSEEKGRIRIEIRDNGCGMTPEVRETIQGMIDVNELTEEDEEEDQIGIGIQNCVTRLRMYYGPNMDVILESEEGAGTCFTLYLPIPEKLLEEMNMEEDVL